MSVLSFNKEIFTQSQVVIFPTSINKTKQGRVMVCLTLKVFAYLGSVMSCQTCLCLSRKILVFCQENRVYRSKKSTQINFKLLFVYISLHIVYMYIYLYSINTFIHIHICIHICIYNKYICICVHIYTTQLSDFK